MEMARPQSRIHLHRMSTPVAERPPELSAHTRFVPSPGAPDIAAGAPTPHRLSRRLVERFALVAFGLYHLPLFLNNYPSLGGGGFAEGLAVSWGHVFTPPGVWVARHVLNITGPMPGAYQGDNGDVAEEFGRLLLAVVIGVVVALVWSVADRKRPRNHWVGDTLRVLLRYSIALGLASYAIAKILPQQFPPINTFTLEQRVGDLTPMALLWTFMEYSRPYAFFGGLMELAAVLLLCVRRTATLGAIICVAVMTNVALMNYAYGVPVKLYATMIVLSAAVLLVYDAPRLTAAFLRNATALPVPPAPYWHARISSPVRQTMKVVLVGSVLLSSVVAMRGTLDRPDERQGVDGVWVVTSFTIDGSAATADSSRWTQLSVRGNNLAIRTSTKKTIVCKTTAATFTETAPITCAQNIRGEIRWVRNGDVATIEGTLGGPRVTAAVHHMNRSDYRLMQSKFRWIMD
jgi:hypothetical protein